MPDVYASITEADRATFRTLHTASLMTDALRTGLTVDSAERSVRHLRSLLPARAVALTDAEQMLAWDGTAEVHRADAGEVARGGVADGGTTVRHHRELACGDLSCPIRSVVVNPLVVDDRVVGTLQVYAGGAPAGLVRATAEVAGWVSGQLDLAELADSRARLMEAEVRALRAQISPHFVYTALNAIASFVRTDPDRARDLLLDFADFTRYSFRRHGEYTTLEEELRCIERYLVLEQARFGERLGVTLRIAPEVLPVTVPVLSLQPEQLSRYRLRRSTRAEHLCTAEVAALCLELSGDSAAAEALGDHFELFTEHYLAAKHHRGVNPDDALHRRLRER